MKCHEKDCANNSGCSLNKNNEASHAEAVYANFVGSSNCTCNDGFEGTGFTCEDIDECDSASDFCDINADCTNIPGSVNCTCIDGWSGPGTFDGGCVQDLPDECAEKLHECDPAADCLDLEVNYNCSCPTCFEGNGFAFGDNAGCTDIDECATGDNNYDAENGFCVNETGKFGCRCNAEFKKAYDDGSICADIDECSGLLANFCHANAECSNTPGAFTCDCAAGFTGDGLTECNDINECKTGEHTCDQTVDNGDVPLGVCDNLEGSFDCVCAEGYVGDGETCKDLKKCLNDNNCSAAKFCVNKPEKLRCRCNDGFSDGSDDGSVCLDIDECAKEKDECSDNAVCNNSHGSYECVCLYGFVSDDNGRTCNDIGECADPTTCDDGATCTHTAVGFSSSSGSEFTGIGTEDDPCVDIDDCDDSTALLGDNCDSTHGQCVNTDGSFECRCNEGYEIQFFNFSVSISRFHFSATTRWRRLSALYDSRWPLQYKCMTFSIDLQHLKKWKQIAQQRTKS